jgi:hypothetical protein
MAAKVVTPLSFLLALDSVLRRFEGRALQISVQILTITIKLYDCSLALTPIY